ncbi:MAG: hypothetical protein J6M93_06345 [Succinivibrio sp.]|nr:hypothetical protein [Succinivibrio sp.]
MNGENDAAELIRQARELSETALKGCPAQTYEQLVPLLDKAVALSPSMNADYAQLLKEIVKNILQAQEIDDLVCISDYLGYELPYILEHCQK